MRLALTPSGLSRKESRGLAGELKTTPGSPWQPEVADTETDCTCSLGALFPQDRLPDST